MDIWNKIDYVLTAAAAFLLVISASIAVPILIRPIYYAQIGPLKLVQTTGYSEEEIREAYDDVMDYLLKGDEFSTGRLPYTEDGKSHFEDCRKLFVLDFWVVGSCAALLLVLWALRSARRRRTPCRFYPKHLPVFWSAIASCAFFAAIAIWGAVSFFSLFVAFHHLFFPGKENWLFDPVLDPIINILPLNYFMYCGALIVLLILVSNILFFVCDGAYRRRTRLR